MWTSLFRVRSLVHSGFNTGEKRRVIAYKSAYERRERIDVVNKPGRDRHAAIREPPARYEYFLTENGNALSPVLKALHGWGERYG